MNPRVRKERDSLGEVMVPVDALFGAQTQRAIENFPISGLRMPAAFIHAVAMIKQAAAIVNCELGLLDKARSGAIVRSARDVFTGRFDGEFPVDVFQTGSGTSTNMNVNEVIARRAVQIRGNGGRQLEIHPNDHVNMGQSSNDVIPSAIHISAHLAVSNSLLPALGHLAATLRKRASKHFKSIKIGRTHLMDAMPLSVGQELSGWASQIEQAGARIQGCLPRLSELALGGTAVGSGVNTHEEFGRRAAANLSTMTGIQFSEARDHFAAQSTLDTAGELSSHLRTGAGTLMKIVNDLRWMNSGPVAGLGEISIPSLQAGSSHMPGKVNPVICEATMMVAAQVMGNDLAISIANQHGNFQLNTMMPLVAHNLLQSIAILSQSTRLLADKVVATLKIHGQRLADRVAETPVLVTALIPHIGYDRAAQIAQIALREGKTIHEVAAAESHLDSALIDRLLDPRRMLAAQRD